MSSAHKQYSKEMRKQFGNYHVTWNPGLPMELGDIGVLKKGMFTKIGNLSSFGIDFQIREDETPTPLQHRSEGGVEVTTKLEAGLPLPGSSLTVDEAGIVVDFKTKNAVLFQANNTYSPSIEDTISLGKEVLKRFKNGDWDKKWAVVTEVVQAESATIVISQSKEGKLELKANGDLSAGSESIADINANFQVRFEKGLDTSIIAKEGLTPLFRVMGIKSKFLSGPDFVPKRTVEFAVDPLLTPGYMEEVEDGDVWFGGV